MSELRQWLKANDEGLVEIARRSSASPELVHLVAVFVADGMSDAEIREQCAALKPRQGTTSELLVSLDAVLPLIRALAEGSVLQGRKATRVA